MCVSFRLFFKHIIDTGRHVQSILVHSAETSFCICVTVSFCTGPIESNRNRHDQPVLSLMVWDSLLFVTITPLAVIVDLLSATETSGQGTLSANPSENTLKSKEKCERYSLRSSHSCLWSRNEYSVISTENNILVYTHSLTIWMKSYPLFLSLHKTHSECTPTRTPI